MLHDSPIDLTSEILFAKTFRFSRILNLGSKIFPNGTFLLSMKLLLAGTCPKNYLQNIRKEI